MDPAAGNFEILPFFFKLAIQVLLSKGLGEVKNVSKADELADVARTVDTLDDTVKIADELTDTVKTACK